MRNVSWIFLQLLMVLVLARSGCPTGSSCVLSFGQRKCEDGAVNRQKWGRIWLTSRGSRTPADRQNTPENNPLLRLNSVSGCRTGLCRCRCFAPDWPTSRCWNTLGSHSEHGLTRRLGSASLTADSCSVSLFPRKDRSSRWSGDAPLQLFVTLCDRSRGAAKKWLLDPRRGRRRQS